MPKITIGIAGTYSLPRRPKFPATMADLDLALWAVRLAINHADKRPVRLPAQMLPAHPEAGQSSVDCLNGSPRPGVVISRPGPR
jgi:hypothetical protein